MRFVKMHGIGNDYVYIDGFANTIQDPAALARVVSDRHTGIGGDGLILVLPPEASGNGTTAHVRMRMFNADGSESEMCGNGVRCVCKFAHDHNLAKQNPMLVQTGRGVLTLNYTTGSDGKVNQVTVEMGEPILEAAKIPAQFPEPEASPVVDLPLGKYISDSGNAPASWMAACGLDPRMTLVSMGNPHLMLYCKNVQAVPLESIGPFLENQPFFPRRINVHFVQVHSPTEVTMRTWERGSGITMACGTGASAVCVAGVLSHRTSREILAHLPGGDLKLQWRESDNKVLMTGPAVEVFEGNWPGL